MDKTLIIVLDDFSERIFEYSNVTLFDYGTLSTLKAFDTIENGYGTDILTNDRIEVVFEDTVGGFYEVTRDDFQYSRQSDIDVIDTTTTVDNNGDQVIEYTYTFFQRETVGDEAVPLHGDWVVESIMQSLTDPTRTDILAIDVDTVLHYDVSFQNVTTNFDGQEFVEPALVKALFDYLIVYDAGFNNAAVNTYLVSALSVSMGGAQIEQAEIDTLDYFDILDIPVFQAAANTSQPELVDWESVYENVITVGAWNTAGDGNLLLSSETSFDLVEVAGDGAVEREDWGFNFGTSFATPKIAGEFTNLANNILVDLENQGQSLSDFSDSFFIPPQFNTLAANAVSELATNVNVSFVGDARPDIVLPISNATIEASGGVNPVALTGGTGLPNTNIASATIAGQTDGPTEGPDVLTGGPGADSIAALGGNDTITGAGGDDQINGGGGTDTAVYSGSQNSYAVILSQNATTIVDRRADGNGSDTLTSIEFLDFDDDLFDGPFALNVGTPGLNASDFESFIELYIAYFNRAPDAIGLNFWGTAFSNGTTLEEMATFFIDQVETRATYPSGTSNNEFATSVYNNVLGRTPDQEGIDFWVGALDSGNVTRDQFILEALRGAKSDLKPELGQAFVDQQLADRAYLETKVDLGALYAVQYGMSNVPNAVSSMALYDGTQDSVAAAIDAINGHYTAALDPITGEFLIQVTGVLDSPFIA